MRVISSEAVSYVALTITVRVSVPVDNNDTVRELSALYVAVRVAVGGGVNVGTRVDVLLVVISFDTLNVHVSVCLPVAVPTGGDTECDVDLCAILCVRTPEDVSAAVVDSALVRVSVTSAGLVAVAVGSFTTVQPVFWWLKAIVAYQLTAAGGLVGSFKQLYGIHIVKQSVV